MVQHRSPRIPTIVTSFRPATRPAAPRPAVSNPALSFQPGGLLYSEGEQAEAVFVVLTGRVRLTRRGENGAAMVTGLLRPGDLLGLDSLSQATYDETARAECDCTARAVPVSMLDRLLAQQRGFAAGLLQAMVRRRTAAEALLTRALLAGVAGRLAGVLLDAAEGRIVVMQTRQQLAEAAWTTRETATRLLFQLAAEGLVRVEGRRLELLDLEGLRRLAAGARQLPAA